MNRKLLLAASTAALIVAPSFAVAQSSSANASSAKTTQQADAKPLADLEAAAQRLRDAIHAMAQAPAGPQRNQAIRQANEALMRVHNAYGALPSGVLQAAGSDAPDAQYKSAMTKLETAAQRLRDTTHDLAREPASDKRAGAIRAVNKALLDTQQAMIDMPMGSSAAPHK